MSAKEINNDNNSTPMATEEKPGILTGKEIKDMKLIEPMDEDFIRNCLKAASCDLRLGYEVLECGKGKPIFKKLKEKDPVTMESFGRIIFTTKEKIILSEHEDIVGRFDLMIRHGLDGLILQVGTQVEPGYEGPLFGLLINTQGINKTLNAGDRFLTIEFSRINKKPPNDAIKRKTIKDLHMFLTNQKLDFDRAAEASIIEKVKSEQRDCQLRHGLKRSIEDSKIARRRFWIAIFTLLLSIIGLFIAYPEKLVSFKQRFIRNIVRIFAEDGGEKENAIQTEEGEIQESLKDNK